MLWVTAKKVVNERRIEEEVARRNKKKDLKIARQDLGQVGETKHFFFFWSIKCKLLLLFGYC